jgi:uncharacterized protein (DUF362 family)
MRSRPVKPEDVSRQPSRRDVLRASAAAAFGAFVPTVRGSGPPPSTAPAAQPATRPAEPPPWWVDPDPRHARVIEVSSPNVFGGEEVDRVVCGEMVDLALQVLTQTATVTAAWRQILGDARKIVLKFNAVGADVLGTNPGVAGALVDSLQRAGITPKSLTAVDLSPEAAREVGVRLPKGGWVSGIPVGRHTEELTRYLADADAIINVPLLKTHRIAALSGAMKNISHAVIRHPARYHENGCSPYVAQVIAHRRVSAKLRLHVVNALRTVIRNGPDAQRGDVAQDSRLVLGFDPVAVDTIGLELLAAQRRRRGLTEPLSVRYLEAAAKMKVGRRAMHEITYVPVRHGI